MFDDAFAPIREIIQDIARRSEALQTQIDDSWTEEQQKLLEIVRISAYNPARWLVPLPAEPDAMTIWKHDALSPLIAITSAAELLVEDFETVSRPVLKDQAQNIYDASVKARELVIEFADAALRRAPNG